MDVRISEIWSCLSSFQLKLWQLSFESAANRLDIFLQIPERHKGQYANHVLELFITIKDLT